MENTETKAEFEQWLNSREPYQEPTNYEILVTGLEIIHNERAKRFPDANFISAWDVIKSKYAK